MSSFLMYATLVRLSYKNMTKWPNSIPRRYEDKERALIFRKLMCRSTSSSVYTHWAVNAFRWVSHPIFNTFVNNHRNWVEYACLDDCEELVSREMLCGWGLDATADRSIHTSLNLFWENQILHKVDLHAQVFHLLLGLKIQFLHTGHNS